MKSLIGKLVLTGTLCLACNTAANAQWGLYKIIPLGENPGSSVTGINIKGDYFVSAISVSVSASAWSKARVTVTKVPLPIPGPTQYYIYETPSYPEASGSIGASWTVYYNWTGADEPPSGTVMANASGNVSGSLSSIEGVGYASSSLGISTTLPMGAEGWTDSLFYNKAVEGSVVFESLNVQNVDPIDVAYYNKIVRATMTASASAKAKAVGDPHTAELTVKAKALISTFGPGRVL